MERYKSRSPDDTIEIGKKIGKVLKKRDVVFISGDLGAGKTILVNGIAKSLGIMEHLSSPTFTIVNEYYGNINLYHFDLYRIDTIDELYDIGFFDYFDYNGIIVIEWADKIMNEINGVKYKHIDIKKDIQDENIRQINITWQGSFKNINGKIYIKQD